MSQAPTSLSLVLWQDIFLRLFSNDPIDESAEDLEHDITEEPPKSVNIIDANRKYTQHFVEDALS